MSAQHTPGPWEKDRDSDGRWMICSGTETTVCRGIKNEADADLIVVAINTLLKPPKDAWEVSGALARTMADGINFDHFISATPAQRNRMLRAERLRAAEEPWVATPPPPPAPLTNNQRATLEWFSARGWVSYHDWRSEFTTSTTRSLRKRALLEEDESQRTTTYRITNAGRAAIAKATGSEPVETAQSGHQAGAQGVASSGAVDGGSLS